ncbi:MAG: delta-60 repeat domain-containing protein [Rubrivivax sp.]
MTSSLFKSPLAIAASLTLTLAACGGGGGGSDPTPPPPASTGKLSLVGDRTITQANDLRGVTYAANGKIYASGHSGAVTSDRRTVVARFNADGSLDTTFGTGGTVSFNLAVKDATNPTSTGDEQSSSIVELSNGDLIVAVNLADNNGGAPISNGTTTLPRPEGASVVLLRLTSTGAPVASFGTNGVAKVDFGWTDADNAAWPTPTFNAAGTALVGTGYPRDTMWNIQRDPSATGTNERIVVFGFGPAARAATGTQRTDNDRYVIRIMAGTGAPDAAFNGGKPFTWNSPDSATDNTRNGIVEPDGRIVSGGYSGVSGGGLNRIVVFRLNTSGQLDSTFGNFGLTPPQPGVAVFNSFAVNNGPSEAYGIGRQSDGKIVTTGYGGATAVTTPATASTLGYVSTLMPDLLTYRIGGAGLDPAYGNNGALAVQSEGKNRGTTEDRGRALVVLSDDRTVQVGHYGGGAAVYVFTKDGRLDTRADVGFTELAGAVSGDGILELPASATLATPNSVALSPDGKRLAVTTSADDAGARLVVLNVD